MTGPASLKAAAARVRDDLRELDQRIAALARERSETEAAPLPPDDFADQVISIIDDAASGYADRLQNDLRAYMTPTAMTSEHTAIALSGAVLCHGQPPALAMGAPPLDGRALSLPAVWYLLGDIIKPKVRETIAAMPAPENVGLPRAARSARLREIDDELRDLEAKRARLLEDVRQAGIQLA